MSKLKRVVIMEEYVSITKNDSMALLLNQLIYWSKRTTDYNKFIQEEYNRVLTGKDTYKYGWIYKSYSELKHELMSSNSTKTIGRYLLKLIEMGYIMRKRNDKYKYDKKYLYRVNLINIINALHENGYEIPDYNFEIPNVPSKRSNVSSMGHGDPSEGHHDRAIA
jgi:hypothetical protein